MAFHVTQCPGCDSTFNTSARLLESAAGRVRCGYCLAVFDAMQYFVDQDHILSPGIEEDSVFVGNNPQDYFDPVNFLTRSALTDGMSAANFTDVEIANAPGHTQAGMARTGSPSEFPSDEIEDQQVLPEKESYVQEQESEIGQLVDRSESRQTQDSPGHQESISSAPDFSAAMFDQDSGETDELESTAEDEALGQMSPDAELQTADEFASDLDPEPDLSTEIAEESVASETFPESDAEIVTDIGLEFQDDSRLQDEQNRESAQRFDSMPSITEQSDQNRTVSDFREAFSEDLDSEPDADEELEPEVDGDIPSSTDIELDEVFTSTNPELQQSEPEPDPDPEPEAMPTIAGAESDEEDTDSTAAIRARALEAELTDEEALEAIPTENLTILSKVSTPVELLASRETRWLRQLTLTVGVLLLTLVLIAQFLGQQIAVYSQLTQIRPFYEFGCQWLTCELPVYSNIDAIRSDNLVVRSHPQIANALMVNVEFRNTADFPQEFPILILSFNTAANDIVALREFSAAEYLAPGLVTESLMPVRTPVQISLELRDPGPDAVNYTLAFRRPSVFN